MAVRRADEATDQLPTPATVALVYIGSALAWIILTEIVMRGLWVTRGQFMLVQVIKDTVFAVFAGAVLFALARRRESALRRSRATLRQRTRLLDHVLTASPVVIYRMEPRGTGIVPTWVSDSIRRVLGYPPDDTLRSEWWQQRVYPDDRGAAMTAAATALERGALTYVYRFAAADGTYRWLQDTLQVQRDDGRVEILGAWLDITDQKEAELALRERETFYRRLIEHGADMLLVLGGDGRVEYASPSVERIIGYTEQEFIDSSAFEYVHPEDLPPVRAAFERALTHPGELVAAEYRVRHKDGHWCHSSAVGRALMDQSPTKLVVSARDVTDRRRLEEQLRQAQKVEELGQLTAGIVHDLNNMLSVILSNVELATDALPHALDEERRKLDDVTRAARGGADMVRKLLAFSRRADLELLPTDVPALVEELQSLLRRILPPQVVIETRIEPELPSAMADAGAVQQIIVNLVTNARDAMPDGGRMRIAVERVTLERAAHRPWVLPGAHVAIRVSDSGTGMDGATLAKIFDPFFTTKPAGKGTGLGMPMIQGLAQQHRGFVDVESEVGAGTSVSVFIPVAAGSARSTGKTPAQGLAGGRETVLLVDDQPELLRAGRRVLERFGYTVRVAETAEEALTVLEEHSPEVDLVLTDLQLPGMDGAGLHQRVRERHPHLRCIVSSGSGLEEAQAQYGLGRVHFLRKPWTVTEMARVVREVLDRPAEPRRTLSH